MSEVKIVPAGTYEALEASARAISAGAVEVAHFTLERLTGGGWDNLGGDVPIRPSYPVPTLVAERHFPTRPRINFRALEQLQSLPDNPLT